MCNLRQCRLSVMTPKTLSVHQPNFFPWLGFFRKVYLSDVFVFLDDVYLPTGSSWINRVKVKNGVNASWLTAEVDSNSRKLRNINLCQFADTPWRKKCWRSIHANYAKSKFWTEYNEVLEDLITNNESNIASYNRKSLDYFLQIFALDHKEILSSSEFGITTSSTQRIVDLSQATGANVYLSGDGAEGYQDNSLFEKLDISVKKMNYEHPRYEHALTPFTPGLSIIDVWLNVGTSGVLQLLESD
jgi:hypothetical protein